MCVLESCVYISSKNIIINIIAINIVIIITIIIIIIVQVHPLVSAREDRLPYVPGPEPSQCQGNYFRYIIYHIS